MGRPVGDALTPHHVAARLPSHSLTVLCSQGRRTVNYAVVQLGTGSTTVWASSGLELGRRRLGRGGARGSADDLGVPPGLRFGVTPRGEAACMFR
jgi:hypothetical protein